MIEYVALVVAVAVIVMLLLRIRQLRHENLILWDQVKRYEKALRIGIVRVTQPDTDEPQDQTG